MSQWCEVFITTRPKFKSVADSWKLQFDQLVASFVTETIALPDSISFSSADRQRLQAEFDVSLKVAARSMTLSGSVPSVAAAKAHLARLFEGHKPEVELVAFADSLGASSVPAPVFAQGVLPCSDFGVRSAHPSHSGAS